MHFKKWVLPIAVLILPLAVYFYIKIAHPFHVVFPVKGSVPDFSLMTQTGNPISKKNLDGKIYVADFIFTRCSDICPRMAVQMTRVQEKYKDNHDFKILSFTVDTENDSLSVLSDYAINCNAIKDKWYFITGKKEEIFSLAREGFKLSAEESADSPQNFIHSDRFVLVDKEGKIRGYYSGLDSTEVNQLIRDIDILFKNGNL